MAEIHLVKHRNNIQLFTPWGPDVPAACKSVNGARWNPDKKCWQYPLQWQVCKEIREKIANVVHRPITFEDSMLEWAMAEKNRQQLIPDVGAVDFVEVPHVKTSNTKVYEALCSRPFQTVSVSYGSKTRALLLADEPGLGKTLQAVAIFEEAQVYGPVLVIAPSAAANITWPTQIRKWGTANDEYIVFGKDIPPELREATLQDIEQDCKEKPKKRIWVFTNPYWIRMKAEVDEFHKYVRSENGVKILMAETPQMFKMEWAGVIADESHETLATKTGNVKKWSQQRQGMGALPIREDGIKLSLSGTPMRGKPEMMFGHLTWLFPDIYTGFWKWAKRHFKVEADSWSGSDKIAGGLLDPTAFYAELAPYMIRRTKAQVAKDLPPILYGGERYDLDDPNSVIGVWLPVEGEQRKQYEQMNLKGIAELDNEEELSAVGYLAEMTRLKQFASSCMEMQMVHKKHKRTPEELLEAYLIQRQNPMNENLTDYEVSEDVELVLEWDEKVYFPKLPSNKFDWFLEFLKERDLLGKGATGTTKILVASQFTKLITLFRNELKTQYDTDSYVISGAVSAKKREEYVESFQNDPNSAKIFFLQTQAGGTSLTLDAADEVVILDEMWNPDNQEQVENRAHRLSRAHNVFVWYVRSDETIETDIGTTLDERMNTCKGIMDGQRGIDFAKKLLQKHRR